MLCIHPDNRLYRRGILVEAKNETLWKKKVALTADKYQATYYKLQDFVHVGVGRPLTDTAGVGPRQDVADNWTGHGSDLEALPTSKRGYNDVVDLCIA